MTENRTLISDLYEKGKPMAEAVVIPANQDHAGAIVERLNNLAPDLAAEMRPDYFHFDEFNIKYQIRMDATREALLREFGWEIRRRKIYDSSEDDGEFPDGYCWEEITEPDLSVPSLSGVQEIGLTQPGVMDKGSDDVVSYELT